MCGVLYYLECLVLRPWKIDQDGVGQKFECKNGGAHVSVGSRRFCMATAQNAFQKPNGDGGVKVTRGSSIIIAAVRGDDLARQKTLTALCRRAPRERHKKNGHWQWKWDGGWPRTWPISSPTLLRIYFNKSRRLVPSAEGTSRNLHTWPPNAAAAKLCTDTERETEIMRGCRLHPQWVRFWHWNFRFKFSNVKILKNKGAESVLF